MATHTIHTSFGHLTEDQFRAYATDLLDSYVTPAERQRSFAYLQQVLAQDKAATDVEQAALLVKRHVRRRQQAALEELSVLNAYDFTKVPGLFVEQVLTDTEILVLLTQDDADVSIRSRNVAGTFVLSGDDVRFIGLGSTGKAVDGTLECTCVCTGQIQVAGNNIKLKGIHFKCPADEAIIFTGPCNSLKLIDCIFESQATYADAMWLYGDGNHLSSTFVCENCLVKNFGSWLLADPTTHSSVPTTKLNRCRFEANKFENCAGSIAVRGQQSSPNGTVSFIDNLFAYGAGGQHAYFWSCIESNNQKALVCTGNKVTGAARKTGGTRGFLQCWSRSSVPWTLTMNTNTLSGFRFALQCACVATFYSPNVQDDDYEVRAVAGEITDTTYGATFVYDWLDATKAYAPENIGTFPSEPTVEGMTKFAHA